MGLRVLIVDDNDDCRVMLSLFVARFGHTVLHASDGLEALEKAVSGRPNLILMDLQMPRMGGLEATKRLKSDPLTKDIPVVICTAFGREASGYRKLTEDAAEIVQKPLGLQQIKRLLDKYLPSTVEASDDLSQADAAGSVGPLPARAAGRI
jgi:twitching motility two-component system response regulator PilH